MKHFALAALSALLLISTTAFAADTAAFSATLPDGFPDFSAEGTQKAQVPDGIIETRPWIARAANGEAVVVTVTKMPNTIQSPHAILGKTRDQLLKVFHSSLENESRLPGTRPGSQLVFRSTDGSAYFRAQLTVINDTIYQVVYFGTSEAQRNAPQIARVFDTFKIK
jgi:hypothetical protein